MTSSLKRTAFALTTFVLLAQAGTPAMAQELDRDQLQRLFQMPQVDKNKDNMVSKQEFMDMMSKAWDMDMAAMPKDQVKAKGKMTLQQYLEFSKMLGLNVGA